MFKTIYGFFHRHFHLRYNGIYRHAKKLFAIDMALLVFAFILLGSSIFFFFWKPSLNNLIDLSVGFSGQRITSGQDVVLTLNYVNRTKFKLSPAILSMHLPDGFVVDRIRTPLHFFTQQSTIDLGTLEPGAKGQAEIYGTIWGEPQKENRISAYLSYTPQDSRRSPDQKISAAIITLSDSILKTQIQLPESAFSGASLPFTYILSNNSDKIINDINLIFDAKQISFNTSTKNITLLAHEQKNIGGTITLPKSVIQTSATISAGVIINNRLITQQTDTRTIKLVQPTVMSSITIPNQIKYIEPGQTFTATVNWKNNGQQEIKDAQVKISFTPAQVVNLSATAKANGLQVSGNDLLINKNTRTTLTNLKPGDSDQIEIQIQTKPQFALDSNLEKLSLAITPVISGTVAGVEKQNWENSGPPTLVPITTEVSLHATARYFTPQGDQLGRGPLPPQVGESTKYWIFVQIKNTSNAVRKTQLTLQLPAFVNLTNKQSVSIGPKPQFDTTSRILSWNNEYLPANSVSGLYFEVEVTPTPDQIGKSLTLVNNINFSARDEFTDKNYSLSQNSITNCLANDDDGAKSDCNVVAQ